MRESLLGRLLLPPTATPPASSERRWQLARARAGVVFFAILFDVGLYFGFRHSDALRPEVVRLFAELNLSLLGTSFVLTVLALRRPHRLYWAVQAICLICEVGSMMVWIQMTGTVTSYFLIMAILIILSYRVAHDYWLGLLCLATVVLLHVGAFTLEELHIFRPASLFVADPGAMYASKSYRVGALSSIFWCDVLTFFSANYLTELLREKDRVLSVMRRDLNRAVAKAEVGRLSGQILGGAYELGELLGRGGMGEVYQARRISDGRELAVKVLLADLGQEPTIRERFRREAEAISRLPPEHVAGFVEMGVSDDGHDFLVMELLRGEDFGAVLKRRGWLQPAELLPIANGIAAALKAAHDNGIIHRDLKPPNVFVDQGGVVRLLDFGIARLLEGESAKTLTMTAMILGTPGYLAPEQARGQHADIGPHTDVFAFGVMIYRALTGKNAFPSRNPVAAAYEALCHHPPPPSTVMLELPSDVDPVMELALAKSIDNRYRDPLLFVRDLALAFDGRLPNEVRERGRALTEGAPTAEATLATAAGSRPKLGRG